MLVQLLNPSPVSATINKIERIGSLYPLDGKVCSTKRLKRVSTLKLHKHKAEDIIEQMVTNAEGLMDEEKDKLRRLLSEYKSIMSLHDGDIQDTLVRCSIILIQVMLNLLNSHLDDCLSTEEMK